MSCGSSPRNTDLTSSRQEVAGTVTISFVNVPAEEALRSILAVNGFGYEKVGNLMLVSALANLSSRNTLATGTLVTGYLPLVT